MRQSRVQRSLQSRQKNNPSATLGLATGSTPLPLYAEMVKDHRDRGTSYKNVRTFNLDEYVGLPASHKESYVNFMTRNLFFKKIDVDMKKTSISPAARRKTSTKNVQGIPPF
ncbi:MAG: 6-phosphogluconolactonase [Clostridiales bacterium]|nr:MAG: 6-phosphogluconolactonase [Clostridiales bacterium]